MLWLTLIAMTACQRVLPVVDTGPKAACVLGEAPQGAVYTSRMGEPYRVVELHSDTLSPLYAMVSFPEDGQMAWPDGAAVAVAAPPVEMGLPGRRSRTPTCSRRWASSRSSRSGRAGLCRGTALGTPLTLAVMHRPRR